MYGADRFLRQDRPGLRAPSVLVTRPRSLVELSHEPVGHAEGEGQRGEGRDCCGANLVPDGSFVRWDHDEGQDAVRTLIEEMEAPPRIELGNVRFAV